MADHTSSEDQPTEASSFWDGEIAQEGNFCLVWSGGAACLMVTDGQLCVIRMLEGAKHVVISVGPLATFEPSPCEGVELLFEDGSNAPFVIHMSAERMAAELPISCQDKAFDVVVYSRRGPHLCCPGSYRRVLLLPYLRLDNRLSQFDGWARRERRTRVSDTSAL